MNYISIWIYYITGNHLHTQIGGDIDMIDMQMSTPCQTAVVDVTRRSSYFVLLKQAMKTDLHLMNEYTDVSKFHEIKTNPINVYNSFL